MGEDNKAKSLFEVLNEFEQERVRTITELRETSEKQTAEQIERIKKESEEKLVENIEFHETRLDSEIQKQYLEHLRENANQISRRSKWLYKSDSGFDSITQTDHYAQIPFTIIYGMLSQTYPNKIGMMFPSYKERMGNGDDFLPERIKALALETILKNKEDLSIKEISIVDDATLTVLCIDFETLTSDKSSEESGVCSKYEQTALLDLLLEDVFDNDHMLKHAKLKFEMMEGAVINYLVPHNLMIETEEKVEEKEVERQERPSGEIRVAYRALEADGYIPEVDVLKYLFELDSQMPEYRGKLATARRVFRDALTYGTFKREFTDFEMRVIGNKTFFKKEGIERMKKGKLEMKLISKDDEKNMADAVIAPEGTKPPQRAELVKQMYDKEIITEHGKKYVRLHCRYAVPLVDEAEPMKFFALGAYSRIHAVVKYGLKRHSIDRNKVGDVPVVMEHILQTPEGDLICYLASDLEVLRNRQKPKRGRKRI